MTTKGSVTGMVGIFILLKYRTKLKDIDFKTLIYVVLLFLVFSRLFFMKIIKKMVCLY